MSDRFRYMEMRRRSTDKRVSGSVLFDVPAGRDLLDAVGRLARTHPELAARALRAVFSDGVTLADGERISHSVDSAQGGVVEVAENMAQVDGQSVDHAPVPQSKRVVNRVFETPTPALTPERIPRKVYSASGKGPIPSNLTPAQAQVLNTLVSTHERYTVDDLASSCDLKRKSVENILSVLRGRKLIDTHVPRGE